MVAATGRIAIAVAAALAWARLAPAQEGEVPGAVARMTAAYLAAEEGDAARAVVSLADDCWYVRRFALVRLRAMGMPDDACASLRPFAVPGAQGKPGEDALAPCRDWAKGVPRHPEGAVFKPAPIDAVTAIASILEEEFRVARRDPALGRGLLGGLVDLLAECAGHEERAWLARRVLDVLEGARALEDIGLPALPQGEKELTEACARLAAWFAQNRDFHYYHPGERRFRLDAAARAAGVPTDEFRKTKPWGEKEGPNAPAEHEGPVK